MNCLDCGAPAVVGVCVDCGAAVCRDHVVVAEVHLTRTMPINRQVPVQPAARRLRCTVCNAAHLATTR
ncbi:DUF2180 family protein [Micromonospora sp. PPF5-17]|uniref:DUF2180 family protein n=1 Tax=Micromonospora solifontis TaxID=2487138 RepID=A0ABX9WAG1_9ACTN|nr:MULTISPECIES: DUF2180 family protein [Micromonospora]NES17124.1 DUF2180 family protein [Micromonospora sp. PPF5-17B]NES38980.1 DUF2180 family protein [Micromonospora solifontis]NES58899.1 DUF2180 family protein [Micromonospora sp. PPF5-6]RNL91995.1 DUF2180 family protein [Micromonospora solifontis]